MADFSNMTDEQLVQTYKRLKAQSGGKSSKPMPPTALKIIDENNDALYGSSQIINNLERYSKQIQDEKLNLGPVENLKSGFKNFSGMSDQNSRNYGSFRAALEKLRNDSLRLNKGIQTEGDAQRAWNELVSNVNDEKFVAQRLREIQDINRRAVQFRKSKINLIRQNYGLGPQDFSIFDIGDTPAQQNMQPQQNANNDPLGLFQ